MTVWADQLADQLADPNMSASIVYVPRNGAPVGPFLALVDRLDEEGTTGGYGVEQHILTFTLPAAVVADQPGRGDLIVHDGREWRVGGPADSEEEGAAWVVRAERLPGD